MIEADALTKDYGKFRAVDGVTFTVSPGDVLGFLGPNGAGKSTTMKMLTGFLPATAGTARLCGHDVSEDPIAAKSQLGYLPEVGPLYQEMTVEEFLRFVAQIRGMKNGAARSAIARVIDLCNLEFVTRQTMDTLSKGYRQRVGLAQALIHDPRCLVLDEPTDGLDPNQKEEVRALITRMARDKAIILSTHILEEVSAMCNRVIIIASGKTLVDERPEDLIRRHPRYNWLEIRGPEASITSLHSMLSGHFQVQSATVESAAVLRVQPKGQADLRSLVHGMAADKRLPLDAVDCEKVRLEEVFLTITQQSEA